MSGNALVEVCGRIMFGLTRSVAEHINPNEAELDSESFGFSRLESTGLEWNCHPVDELIYQEYGDREVTSAGFVAFNNIQPRLVNACLPEDSVETSEAIEEGAMAWKKYRPSLKRTVWRSLYFGFLISVLSAATIGIISILVYYLKYQTILVCLARPKQSAVPIKIQWSQTISDVTTLVFSHVWFFFNILFFFRPYQIKGLKRILVLISFVFYVLNWIYRLALQGFGIYYSIWTPVLKTPENFLFILGICVQSWIIARHFSSCNGVKKLQTFLLMIVSCAFTLVMGILVANFVYPAYNKQEKTGKMCIAIFTPLIPVVLKGISRLCIQRLWRISHPGTSFVLLVPLYYGSAVVLRLLQVDFKSLAFVALIGIIHGIAEVIERSAVVLIDYIYYQLYERRRVPWGNFRSPRRERLATDIAIMSMLYEASAIISVNGYLHLHEYFYTDNTTSIEIVTSFAITTSVPLSIEWFFSGMSLAVETHYQNRPVIAVWRRQWKRHLMVAIMSAVPIAVWTSSSLLIAIQGQFSNIKDYCEMPFSHP